MLIVVAQADVPDLILSNMLTATAEVWGEVANALGSTTLDRADRLTLERVLRAIQAMTGVIQQKDGWPLHLIDSTADGEFRFGHRGGLE